MDERERTRISKFLSLVLRHRPAIVGIDLDEAGWVHVDLLLEQVRTQGKAITREDIDQVVATCPKQRFALSDDGQRIRANQGHSVDVELGYEPSAPPELLFHGTVAKYLDSIRDLGLVKKERHHVHLSSDRETAASVGQRRGKAIILVVRARDMALTGHEFYLSSNGVWLTEHVLPSFIQFPA